MGRKASESFSQPEKRLPNEWPLEASPQEQPLSPDGASGDSSEQTTQGSEQEQGGEVRPRILREVAQMTVQSFSSAREAMSAALEVIGRFLDCQTLFIGRVGKNEDGKASAASDDLVKQHTLKIMEARNIGTSRPVVGSEGALDRTYCQTVWRTRQPLIVEDSSQQPFYQRLPTTEDYNIGFYIGVPLIYSDGRVYGTLCAQDPHPRQLSDRPEMLELMQIVARLLISYIEHEELTIQLRAAEQAQAEFLSIASHELKGPLTTIKGNIQLAQRTLHRVLSRRSGELEASFSLLEKIQQYLERAEHRVHMQNRLASDLIDVSRIRAGKLELHMQRCDMGQIVHEIVEDERQATQERVINLGLPVEPMVVNGDADRLGQVVSNYLTNALKYSPSDEPVGVAVTIDGDTVRVVVSDRGAGLTQDEQKRVWERFYRAKDVKVLSGSGIGLGLGLHICKTIIEQHGGSVGLHSIPGQGSRFWFTLPLYVEGSSC
jgi:signal transduction histidine kinase